MIATSKSVRLWGFPRKSWTRPTIRG
jgi:hypothetical protein